MNLTMIDHAMHHNPTTAQASGSVTGQENELYNARFGEKVQSQLRNQPRGRTW